MTTGGMTAERLVEFFAAWNAHDVERIVGYFTPDGEYLASFGPHADGTAFRGIDEVRQGVKAFLDKFADARYDDLVVMVAGNRGHATWTFAGHDTAGTLVTYRGVDVLEFSGDLIRLKDAFRKERSGRLGQS